MYPNVVTLEPESHKYYHGNGQEYLSVSRLLGLISEKFEDTAAYQRADEETRAKWKEKGKVASDHGTAIHNALELYSKTGQILIENAHLEPAIKSISAEYKDYHQTYDEICLYNSEYRVAGTSDKVCIVSRSADSEVDLADFKTNMKGEITMYSKYRKRLFSPFDHLHDCNYTKYSFQLSIYAYFFEQLTGKRVRQLWIHYIPPHNLLAHHKIPVIYMKSDVKILLETYRYQILSLLDSHQLKPAF